MQRTTQTDHWMFVHTRCMQAEALCAVQRTGSRHKFHQTKTFVYLPRPEALRKHACSQVTTRDGLPTTAATTPLVFCDSLSHSKSPPARQRLCFNIRANKWNYPCPLHCYFFSVDISAIQSPAQSQRSRARLVVFAISPFRFPDRFPFSLFPSFSLFPFPDRFPLVVVCLAGTFHKRGA